MIEEGYKFKITLKKFVIAYSVSLAGILIPFSIAFIQDYEWPPEMIVYSPFIIGFVVALGNLWKHHNDL